MGKLDWARVVGGGLLAGVVINAGEYLCGGILLNDAWTAQMAALGKAMPSDAMSMTLFFLWGFAVGILAVWIYAAIRPRYGAGPGTAIRAALAVWILGYLLPNGMLATMKLFGRRLMGTSALLGLVEILVATLIGAWIYKEEAAGSASQAG